MNINELRIGNKVLLPRGRHADDKIHTVTGILQLPAGGDVVYLDGIESYGFYITDIEPVLISENIILKCQFEFYHEREEGIYSRDKNGLMDKKIDSQKVRIYTKGDGDLGATIQVEYYEKDNIYYLGFKSDYESGFGLHLKTLHHLQNLWFSIYNKELEVNIMNSIAFSDCINAIIYQIESLNFKPKKKILVLTRKNKIHNIGASVYRKRNR